MSFYLQTYLSFPLTPTLFFPGKEESVATFKGNEFFCYDLSMTPIQSSTDEITLSFRTLQRNGLMLHTGKSADYVNLSLKSGAVWLVINLGSGAFEALVEPVNGKFNDNAWHDVRVTRNLRQVNTVCIIRGRSSQDCASVCHTRYLWIIVFFLSAYGEYVESLSYISPLLLVFLPFCHNRSFFFAGSSWTGGPFLFSITILMLFVSKMNQATNDTCHLHAPVMQRQKIRKTCDR